MPLRLRRPSAGTIRLGGVLLVFAAALVFGRWWWRHEKRKHFVSVGDHGFELNGRPFFPLAVNYVLSKRLLGDSLWLGPSMDYSDSTRIGTSPSQELADLRAQMDLVREMGFNTVRLVGCSDLAVRDDRPYIPVRGLTKVDALFPLDTAVHRERYLRALGDVLGVVSDAGLKAIVLIGLEPDRPASEEHFIRVAQRFAEDTTILAYDLYNEPLYFDPLWRTKAEVNAIGEHWRGLMREHAPWQLWTIGLANLREFLEWDPSIINADFFSFHPYEHEPLQVVNELYYYAQHCSKPWIVGETAIPADNDSVPYADQSRFAENTLRQATACGAWGYSWWQFKDVDWHDFHPDYMGLLNRTGTTTTRSGAVVDGSLKPVTEVFRRFDPMAPSGTCTCADNYYNWTGGRAYRLIGRLVDEDGQAVPDGIVLAWNPDWSQPRNTVTKADGTFELVTDLELAHWSASAPKRTRTQGEVDALAPDQKRGGLTHDLGDVVLWTAPLDQ